MCEFVLVLNTLANGRVRETTAGLLRRLHTHPQMGTFCVCVVCASPVPGEPLGWMAELYSVPAQLEALAVPLTNSSRVCLVFWSPRGSPGLAKSLRSPPLASGGP